MAGRPGGGAQHSLGARHCGRLAAAARFRPGRRLAPPDCPTVRGELLAGCRPAARRRTRPHALRVSRAASQHPAAREHRVRDQRAHLPRGRRGHAAAAARSVDPDHRAARVRARDHSLLRVRQKQLLFAPAVALPLAPRLRFVVGPLVNYARTPADSGTLLRNTGPYYGAGNFGQVGGRAVLELDTRDAPAAPARGTHLRLEGRGYPAAWDVVEPFGSVSAEASTYVSAGDPPAATVALRVGGAHVSGTAPLAEAVYVGGGTTVRGYAEQRFAGTSGAYANAELRLTVARLPAGDVGVFGLADAGRVWVAGEPSDRWHAAAGGGLWFAWRHSRANTVSLAVAKSPERSALYLRTGFMF